MRFPFLSPNHWIVLIFFLVNLFLFGFRVIGSLMPMGVHYIEADKQFIAHRLNTIVYKNDVESLFKRKIVGKWAEMWELYDIFGSSCLEWNVRCHCFSFVFRRKRARDLWYFVKDSQRNFHNNNSQRMYWHGTCFKSCYEHTIIFRPEGHPCDP